MYPAIRKAKNVKQNRNKRAGNGNGIHGGIFKI